MLFPLALAASAQRNSQRLLALLLCFSAGPAIAENRPNVLVVMVDDLGFSDLGCYGSEIETPNLDQLANSGIRFSQFYNTAKCHSSRVSLLTGQYCIAAGNTALNHGVTSAETLQSNGYFTAMTGKWHLKGQPTDFGFQRYFGHLSGACNYFSGDQSFRLNGKTWKVPDNDFYTTVANVDFAIDFLEEARTSEKPWYLYVAFNAPHAPLHALQDDYDKYRDRYNEGWDTIREARFNKQKKLGILPTDTNASPRPSHLPSWNSMPQWRQEYESKRMATLAAMIDRVDQEVGRIIDNLKANAELDNTFVLFVSDNGACPYDRKLPKVDLEPTGTDASFGDSTGWAWARNTPFRYYKQNQFEGGIATPAIVHWPKGIHQNTPKIIDQPAHLIDVLPTLAAITQSPIPEKWDARQLRPVSGQSLTPIFQGRNLERQAPLHFLFSSDRGLRDENWKIVSFRNEPWELYDLSSDRTELNNLAKRHPDRLKEMIDRWTEMSRNVLHAPQRAMAPVKEESEPHRHPEWTNFERELGDSNSARKKNRTKNRNGLRARKNTQMKIIDGVIQLTFTGEDPGIAMNLTPHDLSKGPYLVRFLLSGGCKDAGELFYTTSPKETLPKGERLTFAVHGEATWKEIEIPIDTSSKIHQLRIDVCDGPGEAKIDQLELVDQNGKQLMAWPATQ